MGCTHQRATIAGMQSPVLEATSIEYRMAVQCDAPPKSHPSGGPAFCGWGEESASFPQALQGGSTGTGQVGLVLHRGDGWPWRGT